MTIEFEEEETEENQQYIFTVRQGFNLPPVLDVFIHNSHYGKDESYIKKLIKAANAADKLLNKGKQNPLREKVKFLNSIARDIFVIKLRLKYNSDMYPYICAVVTEGETTRDQFETYLQSLSSDQLNQFLNKAKVLL